jgi:3-hydroxyacyl-CoA dehydrogenase
MLTSVFFRSLRSLSRNQTRLLSSGSSTSFDKVGVVGLGLMGHGIAQVAAASGAHSSVIAYEAEQQYLDRGKSRIEGSISKLVSKGKLSQEDADATLGRITFTTDMNMLADTDFIVEAVIENMELKEDLYTNLGKTCKPETIFASNTSSLSITEMAQFSGRPANFVGIHFFNPVQIMKLVEVIRTEQTDPSVFEKAYNWVGDIGKVAVSCGDTPGTVRDIHRRVSATVSPFHQSVTCIAILIFLSISPLPTSAGFIVNRLLVPSLLQAMLMVDRQDASVKDIDISMQLGAGHPMGPLHLSDYIGLDTCLYIAEGWVEKYPDERAFVVPKCLKAMVEAGDLGRKTGKGFYHWEGDKRGDPVS